MNDTNNINKDGNRDGNKDGNQYGNIPSENTNHNQTQKHTQTYDTNNPFWKIINQILPCKIIHDSKHTLAFHDIHPKDKIHILVIPKGQYTNLAMFLQYATDEEKLDWLASIEHILSTYSHTAAKFMINIGEYQEVPHLHAHLMMH